ncbi:Metalloprotease [Desarmillaria tabescens]|uniref:Neutral protease 2 n=1 Tax=Armillaria tabescens TaxID=1929756 RepID=A0AA39JGT8_ARMTA|nr:Metalloprotease [Desarmillaria tabescens]KAK0441491.1 Metalloprotease [Desarmillaria tabescens]
MLTSFIALALALSTFASPYKRDAGLSVSLSGPASDVTSIDDLKFTATVANTGSESVKILKYGTIFDDMLPTQSFTVTKDGETVDFTGIKISVSLKDTNDSTFAVIPPGQSVTAEHDVSALFDFASAGPGTFTFTPVTVLLYHYYTEAKALASAASSYIAANGTNSLYNSYFGTTPTDTVRAVFDRIANESSNTRTMDCTDPLLLCSQQGLVAYTAQPSTNIFFCNLFFTLDGSAAICSGSVDDTVTADGVTLHEFTHATSHTIDVAYGCANDRALLPAEQAVNADSYECFANEVYKANQCS